MNFKFYSFYSRSSLSDAQNDSIHSRFLFKSCKKKFLSFRFPFSLPYRMKRIPFRVMYPKKKYSIELEVDLCQRKNKKRRKVQYGNQRKIFSEKATLKKTGCFLTQNASVETEQRRKVFIFVARN